MHSHIEPFFHSTVTPHCSCSVISLCLDTEMHLPAGVSPVNRNVGKVHKEHAFTQTWEIQRWYTSYRGIWCWR